MKRITFELIRTAFFLATITAVSVFICVAINEVWLDYLKLSPLMPELVTLNMLLTIFQVTGIIAITTMPIVLFGMACRSYAERQTVAEGETVVKISMVIALIMVVLPALLLVFQERWEHLGYFALYWVGVVLIGQLGKYAPLTPAVVFCLERTANRLGLPK